MRRWYRDHGKRALDICGGLAALILLAPLIVVIALAIRFSIGSPVLFRQWRSGLNGEQFQILKLRTMTEQRDARGALLPDSERTPTLGRLLRVTSLDELPEFFNVLKGEMSLVGPRPLVARYYPYFTQAERSRFAVRPGITGAAQVAGRNCLSWDERIAADLQYVENLSFGMDLKILAITLWKVATHEGSDHDAGRIAVDFDEERRRRKTS